MQELETYEVKEGFFKRQYRKHEKYLSSLFSLSVGLAYIYAFIDWIGALFETARNGSVIGFVMLWLLQGVFMVVGGFIGGVVLFLVLLLLTFIPYLVVRGLARN